MVRFSPLRPLWLFLSSIALTISSLSLAQTPSQAQLEAFKQLPRAQQEALAQQYGVDLQQLQQSGSRSDFSAQETSNQRKVLTPYQSIPYYHGAKQQTDQEEEQFPPSDSSQKTELKAFGYELFEQNPEAFSNSSNIPTPADYVLGPGDELIIQLYGKDNSQHRLSVSREGNIHIPEVGPINLAGLNFSAAKALLSQTVQEQMIGVKSAITLGELRSIRIFILGEVKQPGSYAVSAFSTISNALLQSGGISSIGSLRNIQLKRQGKVHSEFDVYDLLLKGDISQDSRLLPGDVIFVPPLGHTVSINGEVKRPAIYELKTERTASDIVQLAGSFTPNAYPQASKIERIDSNGLRTVVNANLKSPAGIKVKDGDKIEVYSVLEQSENIVELIGHFKRPGPIAWKEGMRLSDAIQSIQHLKANPDLNQALIIRQTQPNRELFALTSSIKDIFLGSTQANIQLQQNDQIFVFDFETDRQQQLAELVEQFKTQVHSGQKPQLVTINGNVRFPGTYPFSQDMSSQALVDIAGGLTDQAYSLNAELTRYTEDENQRQSVSHSNIAISSETKLSLQDQLTIKRQPEWIQDEKVTINGEVLFPGTYLINRGETLSQVIERAGGFTNQAYLDGSIFTREELKQLEQQRLEELQQKLESDIAAANLEQQKPSDKVAKADAEQLLENISELKPLGRMVIDLPSIMNGKMTDIKLANGDTITIPSLKQSVTVVGEVQYPTSHLYTPNLDAKDYINRSGGTNLRADKQRIYVVKANGRVFLPKSSGWFKSSKLEIQPGDTVVVPLDADRIKSLTLWTSVSQIFYQMALGAAAINSL